MIEKIIQIIPAPLGLKAVWADQENREAYFESPIVCLALVNNDAGDGDEFQTVELMHLDDNGVIEETTSLGNFVRVRFDSEGVPKGALKDYWESVDRKKERLEQERRLEGKPTIRRVDQ